MIETPTEGIKRHVVRIRIGESENNTLERRIRIPFDVPWPQYKRAIGPPTRDPH